MPRRPTLPKDPSQRAKAILDSAISKAPTAEEESLTEAQKFAKEGGLKGGRARAIKLSPERRKEIAASAANVRWKGKR